MIKTVVMIMACLTISSFIYTADSKETLPPKLFLGPYYNPITNAAIIAELLKISDKEKRIEYARKKVQQEMDTLKERGELLSNPNKIFNDICSKWGVLAQFVQPLPPTTP